MAREVARDRSRLHHYLSNVVAIKAGVSVALLALAAVIVNVGGYSPDARLAVYLVGAGVAIENLGRTWHSAFQAFERMEFISISLIAPASRHGRRGNRGARARRGPGRRLAHLPGGLGARLRRRALGAAALCRPAAPGGRSFALGSDRQGWHPDRPDRRALSRPAEARPVAAELSRRRGQPRGRLLRSRVPADRGDDVRGLGVRHGAAAVGGAPHRRGPRPRGARLRARRQGHGRASPPGRRGVRDARGSADRAHLRPAATRTPSRRFATSAS